MAANVTFDQLMAGFGIVTVMNACIYVPKKSYTGAFECCAVEGADDGVMKPSDFVYSGESIDTLKIANITQEGPTKTVTGGQYSNTLIKYGKTATVEMQDALGRARTLSRFFGCNYDGYIEATIPKDTETDYDIDVPGITSSSTGIKVLKDGTALTATTGYELGTNKITIKISAKLTDPAIIQIEKPGSRVSITDKFPGAFAIEGKTFFIDQKTGEKVDVNIFIPQFTPDAILTLTQDAEGDATVFDLNGSANVTTIGTSTADKRDVFYEISKDSFFATTSAS